MLLVVVCHETLTSRMEFYLCWGPYRLKEHQRLPRETLGGWSRFLLPMTISRILFLSQIKLLLTFIYRLLSEQTFLFLWNKYPGMWLLGHMFECMCDFIEAVKLIPEQVHHFTFPLQHQKFLFLCISAQVDWCCDKQSGGPHKTFPSPQNPCGRADRL